MAAAGWAAEETAVAVAGLVAAGLEVAGLVAEGLAEAEETASISPRKTGKYLLSCKLFR